MFFLLLAVAGNETTRNAIVARHAGASSSTPTSTQPLRRRPPAADAAVEEILRWATPVHALPPHRHDGLRARRPADRRPATRSSSGTSRPTATRTCSTDPFTFDIERTPNDHIAFGGGGPHFCLGANLARMELRLIFDEIVARLPDMRCAGDVEYLRSNFIGGIKHMPVAFTPGPLAANTV